MKNQIEIAFNSVIDFAAFAEAAIQEPGIKAEISMLTDGTWLAVIAGTSEEYCRRKLENECDSRGFIRI